MEQQRRISVVTNIPESLNSSSASSDSKRAEVAES